VEAELLAHCVLRYMYPDHGEFGIVLLGQRPGRISNGHCTHVITGIYILWHSLELVLRKGAAR
jgi:hypothetical protein